MHLGLSRRVKFYFLLMMLILSKNKNQPVEYRADIDGLRAIAVLSVVFFHAFPSELEGGFVGVDIFFVISGYLITRIIIRENLRKEFNLIDFYGRRIRRIFPALLTVMSFVIIFGYFVLLPDEYISLSGHVLAGALFSSNILLYFESGYFDIGASFKPLLHLWSLAVEEQFYLFWPVITVAALRISRFLSVAVACTLASLLGCVLLTDIDSGMAFYLPFTRFWELSVGSILACVTISHGALVRELRKYASVLSMLGLLLIVVSVSEIDKSKGFPGLYALLPVCGAAALILAGPGGLVNARVLALRPLVWIGLISYPLYLWHWPLLSFVRIAEGSFREAPVEQRIVAVIAAFVLSLATYLFIEKPLRFGSNRDKAAGRLVGTLGVIALFSVTILGMNGVPGRVTLSPAGAAVLTEPYPHPQKNEACTRAYPDLVDAWSCLLSKDRPANVLLVGDSHAHQYYQSLARALPNQSVMNISTPGCLPFAGGALVTPTCEAAIEWTLDFITDNPSIETVILTGYFSYLAAGGFRDGNVEGRRVAAPLTEVARQDFIATAERVLEQLSGAGRTVVVIGDIPDLVIRPLACVTSSNALMNRLRFRAQSSSAVIVEDNDCGIDAQAYLERVAPYQQAVAAAVARAPAVRFFDPTALLCNTETCAIFRDGIALYWNSDHLTVEGADLVVGPLIEAIGLRR